MYDEEAEETFFLVNCCVDMHACMQFYALSIMEEQQLAAGKI